MNDDPSFRSGQPAAWTFHRASARWTYNAFEPPETRPPMPGKEDLGCTPLVLPPARPLTMSLDTAIAERLSCRAYTEGAIGAVDLATVLSTAYGVRGSTQLGAIDLPERPVPSGGGLYPLELYVVIRAVDGVPAGVHHYVPAHHVLEPVRDEALPPTFVTYLFMGQECAADAAAVIVQSFVPGRSLWKYGERGYRYALCEAGHVAQNVNLAAAAIGLGTCNLGGFFDDELAGVLRIDVEHEIPLYATAVGRPAIADRTGRRGLAD